MIARSGVGWTVTQDPSAPATAPRRTAVGLVRACHLQPTLAVTAVTTALAVLSGRDAWGCVAVAVAVLAGQFSTGWSNDWFDAGRDTANGRTDKPIVSGAVDVATVRAAALVALAACVPLSFLSGWRAALVHLVAVGSAWAYNAGVKATVLSPLPYAVSFGLLPAFVTLGLPTHPWPRPTLMVATALLGIGAHFINTLADREDDARSGIAGLPQRMSARACLFTGVLLLSACAVAIWTPRWRLGRRPHRAAGGLPGGCGHGRRHHPAGRAPGGMDVDAGDRPRLPGALRRGPALARATAEATGRGGPSRRRPRNGRIGRDGPTAR